MIGEQGMVLWLIGISGAGKTALGKEIYRLLKKGHPNTVFLDGDEMREVFGNDLGHTTEDRWRNAKRFMGLCRLLSCQDIHVICSILSIFHESQRWNREHLQDYFEVYIEAPFNQLLKRDFNGLYRAALRGEVKNVVGVDIEFPPPLQPDLVIRNDGRLEEFLANAEKIVRLLPGLEEESTDVKRERTSS
jgi:adenylylsulfate kinase